MHNFSRYKLQRAKVKIHFTWLMIIFGVFVTTRKWWLKQMMRLGAGAPKLKWCGPAEHVECYIIHIILFFILLHYCSVAEVRTNQTGDQSVEGGLRLNLEELHNYWCWRSRKRRRTENLILYKESETLIKCHIGNITLASAILAANVTLNVSA